MRPELWTPQATYAATKMFISQLNAHQAQRFLNLVLLNKVRDDIREHKRLHCVLFEAVKKAIFKPGAFYKGFVLPLLKAGDCTLREAVIISSVLKRVSIPVDHSAAVCPLFLNVGHTCCDKSGS
jgi:essential nuclear protein 1